MEYHFTTLLLLNQYDPNIVSQATIATVGAALATNATQNPLFRIGSILASYGTMGTAIWRLATQTSEQIAQGYTIMDANGAIVGRVQNQEALFNLMSSPVPQSSGDGELSVIPYEEHDQIGGRRKSRKTSRKRSRKSRKSRKTKTKRGKRSLRKNKRKTKKNLQRKR